MDFSDALKYLKQGKRLARDGWNGQGMWLLHVPGSTFTVEANRPLGVAAADLIDTEVQYRPHVDLWTADGQLVPWVPSQSDVLAEDWLIVD